MINIKKINRRVVVVTVLIFFAGIFSGILVDAILGEPIKDFVNVYFFGKYSDVGITLNHIFRVSGMENFINISQLYPGIYAFGLFHDYYNNSLMLIIDKRNELEKPSVSMEFDGESLSSMGLIDEWNYIYPNKSIRQYNCVFHFILEGYFKAGKDYKYVAGALTKDKVCTECHEVTIHAENFGTKNLDNFKLETCFNGIVNSTTGDIKKESSSCVEIRIEHFLPKDHLYGTVFIDGEFGTDSFYVWDEYHGEFPRDKLLETAIFIVPNCNLD